MLPFVAVATVAVTEGFTAERTLRSRGLGLVPMNDHEGNRGQCQ